MSVTLNDVDHVATLAHLSFSKEEKEALVSELNAILEYMELLNEADTSAVEPLSHVIEISNVFRNDELRPGLTREDAFRNAPQHSEKFFRVPKVIAER